MPLAWQDWNTRLKWWFSTPSCRIARSNLAQALHLTPGPLVTLGKMGRDEEQQEHNLIFMCHESLMLAECVRPAVYGQTDSTAYSQAGPANWQGRRDHTPFPAAASTTSFSKVLGRIGKTWEKLSVKTANLRYSNYHVPMSNHTIKQDR